MEQQLPPAWVLSPSPQCVYACGGDGGKASSEAAGQFGIGPNGAGDQLADSLPKTTCLDARLLTCLLRYSLRKGTILLSFFWLMCWPAHPWWQSY